MINEEQRLAEAVAIVAEAITVHARAQRTARPDLDQAWILDCARNIVGCLIGTFEAVEAEAVALATSELIGQLTADAKPRT